MRVVSSLPALVTAAAVTLSAAPAQANSKYAAIVVDANSGKTLFESSADAPRYPASLTKMMTLYMTFEAMKAGKMSRSAKVVFSKTCAAKPPTKLGIGAGRSVTTEQAILALVTKSANDAACALGETVGGSEPQFARMMTAKARQLGMSSTAFRNASGLPDDAQRTTARDMATLGIALREHFPQYYSYFSTRSFKFGKQRLANHNKLLGRIKGVDGIKTGYIRASGYNLVSSVTDGDRKVVAVVMGGKSGRSRDDHMAELIKTYLPKASRRGGEPLIASAKETVQAAAAFAEVSEATVPTPASRPMQEVVAAAVGEDNGGPNADRFARDVEVQAYAAPKAKPAPAALDPIETAAIGPSGWVVQVASSPSETAARAVLALTGSKAGDVLASASPFTVPFEKDGTTYYRARFGGFDSKAAAWDACGALKKKKIACYAVQQ
ncbi:MAG TPA: D-alanyl-D-alanine carboxypeptidase family protein [Mesorhizobium sp.]|nr:D-alanyl-D-alanine carboxypeptidase family protein [Mesorhizobium sp.]